MTTQLVDYALDYAADGLEVFPVDPETKAPLGELAPHGMKDATTDADIIAAWWAARPDALIGARLPVDQMCLDIDPRHGADEVWAAILDVHGSLTSRVHYSGRGDGGFHIWLKRPPGRLSTKPLTEWARARGLGSPVGDGDKWTCGIDILHRNLRYTILPPSPHPDTGEPYRWATEVEPAECPQWLVDLIVVPEAPPPAPKAPTVERSESIADWYSDTHSWNDVLSPHGWTLVRGDGDSDGSAWRHPNATADTSATIRHGCLFVYSPNTPFDETSDDEPHGYTLFRAKAVLDHAGDLSAAARVLSDEPGAPQRRQTDISAFIAANGETAAVGDPWPDVEPDALEASPTPGPFPMDALPDWIADRVQSVADAISTPVDLPAMIALGTLSAACMGNVNVRLLGDYTEHTNLYIAVALPPSTGKSPVFKRMTKPLYEAERAMRHEAEPKIAAAKAKVKAAELAEAKAIKSGDVGDIDTATRDLVDARRAVPVMPQLVSDDATPEAFAELLDANAGRMSIMSTEGGPFELMAGRYSDNKRSRLEVYLAAWSGDGVRVNRIRRDEPIIIDQALATVVVTVQPVVLESLNEDMRGKGLTARIMYSMPAPHRRIIDTAGEDTGTVAKYETRMRSVIDRHTGSISTTYALTDDARAAWVAYAQEISDRAYNGDLQLVAEWVGKLTASVGRVAALLHVAAGETGDISPATMASAIAIGDYWLSHAMCVHDLWRVDPGAVNARWIVENFAGQVVRPRQIMEAARRRFPAREDVDKTLEALARKGWVRLVAGVHRAQGNSADAPEYEVREGEVRAVRATNSVHDDMKDKISHSSARGARSVPYVCESSPPPPPHTGTDAQTHDPARTARTARTSTDDGLVARTARTSNDDDFDPEALI